MPKTRSVRCERNPFEFVLSQSHLVGGALVDKTATRRVTQIALSIVTESG
jgi:hypothetical protein